MEALVNPSYQPQLENDSVEEKIIQIKKDLGINLNTEINIEDIKNNLYFEKKQRLNNLIYITKNKEKIRLGDFEIENNKILYLYSINDEIKSKKKRIRGLGSFILQHAIKKIKGNIVHLSPLDDVIGFYKKVLERFKKNGIIKDFNIKEGLEIEIIKN